MTERIPMIWLSRNYLQNVKSNSIYWKIDSMFFTSKIVIGSKNCDFFTLSTYHPIIPWQVWEKTAELKKKIQEIAFYKIDPTKNTLEYSDFTLHAEL